jgi:hypothetical protein
MYINVVDIMCSVVCSVPIFLQCNFSEKGLSLNRHLCKICGGLL